MSYYGECFGELTEVAKASGADITSFIHPLAGPDGVKISCEVFYFGPKDAERVMVVISGTHGLEGPAGAKFQIQLLKGISDKSGNVALPADTALLLVFALNPWGFAHGERTDEDNVDVNRNAVCSDEDRVTVCGHEKVVNVIAPFKWSETVMPSVMNCMRGMGPERFQRAVTGGQFDFSQSLFYGGRGEAWSVITLRRICERFFMEAKKVAVIDVHTGLGPYAKGDKISPAADLNGKLAVRARRWLGIDVQFPNAKEGQSVSSSVAGDILSAMVRWLPDTEVTPIAVEIGVLSVPDALFRMIAANWVRFNGDEVGDGFLEKAKLQLWEAFYPSEDLFWRGAVWSACYNAYQAMMLGLQQD